MNLAFATIDLRLGLYWLDLYSSHFLTGVTGACWIVLLARIVITSLFINLVGQETAKGSLRS